MTNRGLKIKIRDKKQVEPQKLNNINYRLDLIKCNKKGEREVINISKKPVSQLGSIINECCLPMQFRFDF